MFKVSDSTMWPTSQLIGLTSAWWNCILYISVIYGCYVSNGYRLVVEPIRHVVPERSSASYSADELKAIRSSGPRARLPTEVWEHIISTEVWEHIISLGTRKRNRSKRAGRRRECTNRSVVESVVCDPRNVNNFNQSRQAEQRQQDVRSPASIPSVIYANIRSVNNKIDELQAVVSVNDPSIVCLSETWLNSVTKLCLRSY